MNTALSLVARDVPVFPCGPDKRPLTPHGFKDATSKSSQVEYWWRQWPYALVGTPAGDRFVVLDVDLRHQEAADWYDRNQTRIPRTRQHRTRSGGWHLLFKPHARFTCSAGKIQHGIDTRGRGGYIIWWPAHGHEVINPNILAELPAWLIAALRPPAPSGTGTPISAINTDRSIAGLIRTIAGANVGERNHLCFWGACRFAELVKDKAIGEGTAIEIIIEAANRAGLSHIEAERTVKSAFRTIGV